MRTPCRNGPAGLVKIQTWSKGQVWRRAPSVNYQAQNAHPEQHQRAGLGNHIHGGAARESADRVRAAHRKRLVLAHPRNVIVHCRLALCRPDRRDWGRHRPATKRCRRRHSQSRPRSCSVSRGVNDVVAGALRAVRPPVDANASCSIVTIAVVSSVRVFFRWHNYASCFGPTIIGHGLFWWIDRPRISWAY